jgi:uncharacterized membrane protein YraQ (UPF0718 family)
MRKFFKPSAVFTAAFIIFCSVSLITGFKPGLEISINFKNTLLSFAAFIPPVFILLGLFDVWVKKETVEKHLGNKMSLPGFAAIIILAGGSIGALYTALPAAESLYKKGAGLFTVFFYISSATIFRLPMTIFEASYVGIKFTAIRLLCALPLLFISSRLLARLCSRDTLFTAGTS